MSRTAAVDRRTRWLYATVAAGTLLLAACGSEGASDAPRSEPPTTSAAVDTPPSPTPSPTPAAEAHPTASPDAVAVEGEPRDCRGAAGVCIGDTRAEARDVLGQPYEIEEDDGYGTDRYRFASGARLSVSAEVDGPIYDLTAWADEGQRLTTHGGITLGEMTLADVIELQGGPSSSVFANTFGDHRAVAMLWPGGTADGDGMVNVTVLLEEDDPLVDELADLGVDFSVGSPPIAADIRAEIAPIVAETVTYSFQIQ